MPASHEAADPETAPEPLQVAFQRRVQLSQEIDRAETGRLLAFLHTQLDADTSDMRHSPVALRHLTGDKQQASTFGGWNVVRDRGRRFWQFEAEVRQPAVELASQISSPS